MKNSKMKKIIAVALIGVFIASAVIYKIYTKDNTNGVSSEKTTKSTTKVKAAEYESLFKKDNVIDIKVEIPESDFKAILDNPNAEEYKSANITVNGETVKNVGFRAKGNLTLRSVASSDSDRFSFKIKVDEYEDGQKLLGLDEFVVNNMYADPSYLREYLSYEALKSIGADVPDTTFVNVYINGKLYGFYLFVESVDDSFLKRYFGNNDGNLYRQDQGSTLQYTANSNYDSSSQKQGKDETKTDLKNLIKTLNEMPQGQKGNIESVLDVDSALKYIAGNTVLGSYDSYNGNLAQNYYLYGQDGKFTVIPWDYNMSIGGFSMGGGDQTTIPIDEPVLGANIKNLPLINNLLAVPEYKEKYHQYVSQLLGYLSNFENRVTEVSNIIRPYVQADPSKFYTMEQFEANIMYSETSTTTSSNNAGNFPLDGNMPADGNMQAPPQGGFGGNMQGAPAAQDGNMQQGGPGMQGSNFQGRPGDMGGNTNGRQNGGRGNNMQDGQRGAGGPRGLGMMGNQTSIINFVRARVTNIKKQLAGELPTTGNTTMNNNMMGGRK